MLVSQQRLKECHLRQLLAVSCQKQLRLGSGSRAHVATGNGWDEDQTGLLAPQSSFVPKITIRLSAGPEGTWRGSPVCTDHLNSMLFPEIVLRIWENQVFLDSTTKKHEKKKNKKIKALPNRVALNGGQ